MLRSVLCAVAVLACCSVIQAELPSIRFDRLNPIGAGAGTTVDIEVQGRDTEEVSALLFDHPGLKAELLKPNQFKISVAVDVPEGTYDVRLVGRFGVSNPRLFAVTRELMDVAEKEPNNTVTEAQVVPLNSAINGVSDGNGQDAFKFSLKKGQRVSLDCQSARLDSQLDGNLILSTASGQILGNNGDYYGRDPYLDYTATADGDFVVIVHDLSYRGGYPYRLLITTRPQIENVFPRAVQIGQTVNATALGRNLIALGGKISATPNDPPLDELLFPLTVPASWKPGEFNFLDHPTDHAVLPTAATCTLDGFQVRVPGSLHPQCILATGHAVTLEAEPNDDRTKGQTLTMPAVVAGRFDRARDADWYALEVAEAGNFFVEVFSERIGGRADPYVALYDEKDNPVGEFDDFGARINAFDGHLRDPSGSFNLQAKQKYKLLVQDRYSRGGARYQYVLCVRKPEPDFHIAGIHSENPGPSGVNLRKGGTTHLDLVVHQQDGFNHPITVTAVDLPPGVHAVPTMVNNNTMAPLVLWADQNAADSLGRLKLIATAKEGDKTWQHEVRPYTRVWAEANVGSSRPMRDLTVAVRETAPYSLAFAPERVTVTNGEKAELKLRVSRISPDFKDKVNVIPLSFSGNFQMGNTEIPASATEIRVSITVQKGTRPGLYTLSVLGQAQVPYSKNAQDASKPNTLVSMPSQPVTLEVK